MLVSAHVALQAAPKLASTALPAASRTALPHASRTALALTHTAAVISQRHLATQARKAVQVASQKKWTKSAPSSLARRHRTSVPSVSVKRHEAKRFYSTTPPSPNNYIESEFEKVEKEGNRLAVTAYGSRVNTIINICPQQESWIIERFGKYHETVEGGLHLMWPIIDKIAYSLSLKEQTLIIPSRSAITKDNVRIHCIGVLYFKIVDPAKAAYGCGDPVFALSQLAQTSLRSVIGKLTLDETFHERTLVNSRVVETCNDASSVWGIQCLRHEIREIQPPENVLHAMEMQMEAERRKRVDILKSEGEQQATINRAEAKKREVILASEAQRAHQINIAEGEAKSTVIQAEASRQAAILQAEAEKQAAILSAEAAKQAAILDAEGSNQALGQIAHAIAQGQGPDAVQFELARQYIGALGNLAKTNNTMIVPSNIADVASLLAQATTVIKNVPAGSVSPPPSAL